MECSCYKWIALDCPYMEKRNALIHGFFKQKGCGSYRDIWIGRRELRERGRGGGRGREERGEEEEGRRNKRRGGEREEEERRKRGGRREKRREKD